MIRVSDAPPHPVFVVVLLFSSVHIRHKLSVRAETSKRDELCGRNLRDGSTHFSYYCFVVCIRYGIWYTRQVASTTDSFQSSINTCRLSMQYVATTSLSSNIFDT